MNQQSIQIQKKTPIQMAIDILRNCKARQIRGGMFDGKGGMCAIGALNVGFGIEDEFGRVKRYNKEEFRTWDEAFSNPACFGLANLNDGAKMTFSEIADIIEMRMSLIE